VPLSPTQEAPRARLPPNSATTRAEKFELTSTLLLTDENCD
jgi:hypothetical protein